MNTWTTLNTLPAEPYSPSKEFEKLRTGLNREVATLTTARAKYEAEARVLKDADPADLDEARMELLHTLPTTRVGLLRDELTLRRKLSGEYFPARSRERHRAREVALVEAETAVEDVLGQLVRIGYAVEDLNPEFMHRHPKVREARRKADMLLDMTIAREDRDANDSALAEVEEKLRQIVARAVA